MDPTPDVTSVAIGIPIPIAGGVSFNLRYKNFTLSALVDITGAWWPMVPKPCCSIMGTSATTGQRIC